MKNPFQFRFRKSVSTLVSTGMGVLTALSSFTLGARPASADNGVNVHYFFPVSNMAYILSEDTLLKRNWNQKPGHRLISSIYYDYVHRPLVELDASRTYRVGDIVKAMHTLDFMVGYSFTDDLQVSALTSLSSVYWPNGSTQLGMGETRLQAKYKLLADDAIVSAAIIPFLTLPTGRTSLYLSDGFIGGGAKLAVERDFREIVLAANIGFHKAPSGWTQDLVMRDRIPLSLSALIPIGSRWAMNAEASGDVILPFNSYSTPSMFYLGGRYRIPSDLMFTFGGAMGSLNNYSSANFRVMVGLICAPFKEGPAAPVAVAVAPTPKPSRVVFTPKEVIIREEVKFEFNKAILTPAGAALLDEVAKVMTDNDRFYDTIMIEGHTDETGSIKYNQGLSDRRAAAVLNYLVSKGVKREKLTSRGFGKTRLKFTKASGLSKEARDAANRRVEFKVLQTSEETKRAVREAAEHNEAFKSYLEDLNRTEVLQKPVVAKKGKGKTTKKGSKGTAASSSKASAGSKKKGATLPSSKKPTKKAPKSASADVSSEPGTAPAAKTETSSVQKTPSTATVNTPNHPSGSTTTAP